MLLILLDVLKVSNLLLISLFNYELGALSRAMAAAEDGRYIGKNGRPILFTLSLTKKVLEWLSTEVQTYKVTFKVFQKKVCITLSSLLLFLLLINY